MSKKKSENRPVVNCAIYTRKSTDEGLEKDFNTLDAQRESGESYIKSQINEGWVCLPDHYDDGGFTGGNMERPALQRLLNDVKAGKVQVVIVYKIDRLSRSLLDFAKIAEILEQHSASFAAVTQNFNTKDSMGRLTLNILYSFAQFEREIISERTRDKIAAARRKGKWTGGMPILGYDIDSQSGKLVINEEEAVRVKRIFEFYLKHRSLKRTLNYLNLLNWKSKSWITTSGKLHAGTLYDKKRLSKLLRNVLYIGKVRYKEEVYEGEHEAIIDIDTWNEVQVQLKRGDRLPHQPSNKYNALLRGLLYCTVCDAPMIHLPIAKKGQKIYRYYVCDSAHNNGYESCPMPSIPAVEIERFVVERIQDVGADDAMVDRVIPIAKELWREHVDSLEREDQLLREELKRIESSKRAQDQQRARSLQIKIANLKQHIELAKKNGVTALECEEGLGRFQMLWDILDIDEQTYLLKLIFERIGFDGRNSKIQFTYHHQEIITGGGLIVPKNTRKV